MILAHALGGFVVYAGIGLAMTVFALLKIQIDAWALRRWRERTFKQ